MNIVEIKERILFKNGKPNAVVLDFKKYKKLLETAEAKEDLSELKRIKKSETLFIELKSYLKKRVRV